MPTIPEHPTTANTADAQRLRIALARIHELEAAMRDAQRWLVSERCLDLFDRLLDDTR